jgi:acid phosphatase family membrane protein YuiD
MPLPWVAERLQSAQRDGMRSPTSETSDVLSTLFFLKVGDESFDVSIPERGAEGKVSFGVLPADIQGLKRHLGEDARIMNGAGEELLRFHLEHLAEDLKVVSGHRLTDIPAAHP